MKANSGMPNWMVPACNPQTWVAVAVTVVGAGVSAYSTYSQGQKQKKAAGQQAQALKEGIKPLEDPVLLGDPAKVDTRKVNLDTIDQTFDQFPYAARLADTASAYNYKTALNYYRKIQPYFSQIQSQVGKNALSYARGEIPTDVANQLQRQTAERNVRAGVGFGTQGGQSGVAANALARNLGLTSLDLSRYGTTLGMQVNQSAKSLLPELVNPLSFFLNPGQQLQAASQNAQVQNEFAVKNNALINNTAQANTELQNNLTSTLAGLNYNGQLAAAMAQGEAGRQIGSGISGLASGNLLGGGAGAGASQFNTTGSLAGTGGYVPVQTGSWRTNASLATSPRLA